MKSKKISLRSSILNSLLIIIAVMLLRCKGPEGTAITIYSSSQDGDRLLKKTGEKFRRDRKESMPVIAVDQETKFQKIDGFGATFNEAGMICLNALSADARDKVLVSLFDSLTGSGFNLMKSPIAACDFASAGPWYTYDDTPGDTMMEHFTIARDLAPDGLITFIQQAKRFGKFQIESPMDFAPDWMYFSLKKGEKHIKPEYYRSLARYYSKYLKSYADNGINIGYLNLFNEAHNAWYSNVTYEVMGELIRDYVVPQLKADGLNTKIQLGETANRPEAIKKFPAVLDDPSIRKYIHSLTVHGYDWDKFSTITELHDRYPDLPIWMTEVCYVTEKLFPKGGPAKSPVFEFSDGERWGNMIVNDMKNWISGWVYWNMILDSNGGPWLISDIHGDPDPNQQHPVVIINRDTKEVTYTGLYYYLSHFSKFVRPGAYRIECTGGPSEFNFAGFQNTDGSIVLNIINNGNEQDCKISWNGKMILQKFKPHSITTLIWNKPE